MEKNIAYVALFAALIAVLGLVPKIDLMSGVPITAQSLGIMLCGTVLGAKRGALVGLASSWGHQRGSLWAFRWPRTLQAG
jgi:biotin transport system substrate-specific component